MDSLVSVIIPAFNYARYLPAAVESALNQTYGNLEVIVIDDGSSDNTAAVAREFGESIRYIYQENEGLSAARNTGIRESRGEHMVFLDADDILAETMVERCLEELFRLGKEYAVIAVQYSIIDEPGNPIPKRRLLGAEDVDVSTLDLLLTNRFGPSVLARKEVFSECGYFDTDLQASEDRDMWIRISSRFKIRRLGEQLYQRRMHGDNMSANGPRQLAMIRKVHQKAWAAGYVKGMDRLIWIKIKSYFYFESSLMLYLHSAIASYGNMARSLVMWPFFVDRRSLGEPALFRLRALARFLLGRHSRARE